MGFCVSSAMARSSAELANSQLDFFQSYLMDRIFTLSADRNKQTHFVRDWHTQNYMIVGCYGNQVLLDNPSYASTIEHIVLLYSQ